MTAKERKALLADSQYGKKRSNRLQELPGMAAATPTRRNKFGAEPVTVNGVYYDSKRESQRHAELILLERSGAISELQYHKVFELVVNKMLICKYEADFVYFEKGRLVVEDVKSEPTRTPAYLIKKALMWACHGIAIHETY